MSDLLVDFCLTRCYREQWTSRADDLYRHRISFSSTITFSPSPEFQRNKETSEFMKCEMKCVIRANSRIETGFDKFFGSDLQPFFLDLFLSSPTRFVVCSAYVLFVSDLQSKKLSSCDWGWKAHCDWSEHNMNIQTLKRFASFSRAYESTPSRRSHVRSPLWIFVWLDIVASNLRVASMTSVCMELVFYQVLLARTMFSLLP